ncbi:MAG: acylneuraminate cytidylyltransferase, partial [Thermosynechococcaceae cyanobacterium]
MSKKNVAIIPARGGSKGLPRKNVRPLLNLPLIAHTILDAKESKFINSIFVSTDDQEIANISRSYDVKVIDRPEELSSDTASSESSLIHALSEIEEHYISPDLIVFLQCTSPIRSGI